MSDRDAWYLSINLLEILRPKPQVKRETIEEFLARGGHVERIDSPREKRERERKEG